MNVKRESYRKELTVVLNDFLKTGRSERLSEYLVLNSSLPGPRGSLELADAFTDVVLEHAEEEPVKLWSLSLGLTRVTSSQAPANDPREFIVFCGVRGIGALGSRPERFNDAVTLLRELSRDSRWRIREGVAMALQILISMKPVTALRELENWIEDDDWLSMRAVAAGVAEPFLLKDARTAELALELHRKIFGKITSSRERGPVFRTLRQGLGYSLSVVVSSIPEEGFEFMRRLAGSRDVDILWVVRENLKKNRLVRRHPREVESIQKLLSNG
jgi:hypothetical protein